MVAAGPAGSTLGADIERIPERFFDGFDDFAAAPAERARLDSMATTAVGPAVAGAGTTERTRLWVAKEAVLKAAGLGLAVEPSSVALTQPWNSPSGSLTAGRFPARRGHEGPLQALCPAVPAVHGLEVSAVPAPAGYVAAVSARTGLPPRRLGLPEMFATSLQTSNV